MEKVQYFHAFTFNCKQIYASGPEVFCKERVLRNFEKFKGKGLCNFIKK